MEEKIYCSRCGELIDTDDYEEFNGEILCFDCIDNFTSVCNCCGERIWSEDTQGDEYTMLCQHFYDYHYTRCEECDALIHNDDAYKYDDGYFCHKCYQKLRRNAPIHEYGYKPEPVLYGDSNRYFGVELEIDGAGKNDDYAEELFDIGNMHDDCIYIKTNGSLDDGMEIVTHPMSLEYHKDFCWEDIMHCTVRLGYRSH